MERSSNWEYHTGATILRMGLFVESLIQVRLKLALALARLFEGPPSLRNLSFRKTDQLALCSLISFNLGILLGRLGDRVGATRRIWMIMATFLQALFTMVAAIAVWKSGQPTILSTKGDPMNWVNVLTFVGLAFMSVSLGLQGVQGKRLDTHFGTTSASRVRISG